MNLYFVTGEYKVKNLRLSLGGDMIKAETRQEAIKKFRDEVMRTKHKLDKYYGVSISPKYFKFNAVSWKLGV